MQQNNQHEQDKLAPDLSRRTFLQAAGAAAAGILLTSCGRVHGSLPLIVPRVKTETQSPTLTAVPPTRYRSIRSRQPR